MLEIRHLRKEYDNVTPLKDVSLTVNDGDAIAIIGPSGTGKSTLIRCINMLEKPTKGQILLNGEDITKKGYDIKNARRKIGMVFQSFNLFGHLTVIENLMTAPCDLLKKSRPAHFTFSRSAAKIGSKFKCNLLIYSMFYGIGRKNALGTVEIVAVIINRLFSMPIFHVSQPP